MTEFGDVGLSTVSFESGAAVSKLNDESKKMLTTLKNDGASATQIITAIDDSMVSLEQTGSKASQVMTKVGTSLLNGLASAAISVAVSLLINLVSDLTDKLIMTRKEAQALSDQFSDTFTSAASKQAQVKKEISDIEDEYEKLSKGVNALGENVSLTDAEFERYHEITQIIANNIPELIQRYGSQGEAIIRLRDNVESLTDAYEKNQQAAALDLYNQTNENGNIIKGVYKNAQADIADEMYETVVNSDLGKVNYQSANIIQQLETRKKLAQATQEELVELYEAGGYAHNVLMELIDEGYDITSTDETEIAKVHAQLQKNATELEITLEDDATRVAQAGLTYAQAYQGYYTDLTTEQQRYVDAVMNSMDFEFIYNNGLFDQDSMEEYVQKIVKTFKDLSSEDIGKIEEYVNISTLWNNNELSYSEYITKLQALDSLLETLFPGDEQIQKSIKIMLDATGIEDIENDIDNIINRRKRVLSKSSTTEEPQTNSLGGQTPLAQDVLKKEASEEDYGIPLTAHIKVEEPTEEELRQSQEAYEKWLNDAELDQEQVSLLKNLDEEDLKLTYHFETTQDFEDWFAELQAEADENPLIVKTKFSEQATDFDTMEDAFGGLSTAYETSQTGEKVSGSELEDVSSDMGGVTFNVTGEDIEDLNALSNALEKYNETLISNAGDVAEAQTAADKLATAYIDQSGVLDELLKDVDNVDEGYKQWVIDQLEAQGISNATEVVNTRLTNQYKKEATALTNLSKKVALYRDKFDTILESHEDFEDTAKTLKDDLTDLLTVYDEAGNAELIPDIDTDFIVEHLDDVYNAIEGDIDAIARLRVAAAEDMMVDVGVDMDDTQAVAAYNELINLVSNLDNSEYCIDGEMDISAISAKLASLVEEAGIAANKIDTVLRTASGGTISSNTEWEEFELQVPDITTVNYNSDVSNYGKGKSNSSTTTHEVSWKTIKYKMPKKTTFEYTSGAAGANYTGGSSSSSDSGSGGSGDSGGSDDTSTDEETFDWVETAINSLEQDLDRLDEAIDDVYDKWDTRNEALANKIQTVTDEIELQQNAAQRYEAEAEKYNDIGADYIQKIKEGILDIETLEVETSDDDDSDTLIEKIQNYQTWLIF